MPARDILRKGAIAINTDAKRIHAEVATAGATIAAYAAGNVTFRRHPIANRKSFDFAATLDNLAEKLVTNCGGNFDRVARPVVPLINMDVGAANSSAFDANQNVVMPNRRSGYVLHPDAAFGFGLDQRFH